MLLIAIKYNVVHLIWKRLRLILPLTIIAVSNIAIMLIVNVIPSSVAHSPSILLMYKVAVIKKPRSLNVVTTSVNPPFNSLLKIFCNVAQKKFSRILRLMMLEEVPAVRLSPLWLVVLLLHNVHLERISLRPVVNLTPRIQSHIHQD